MSDGLSPADILASLQTHLTAFLATQKGKVSIADDAYNVLELLTNSPGAFFVVLHWAGDTPDPDDGDLDGIVDNHIEVIVRQAKRPVAQPGKDLVVDGPLQPSFYKLVSQVRAKVRAWRKAGGDTTNFGEYFYKGAETMIHPTDQFPIRAIKLKFDLKAAVSTDDGTGD
jgi:hypothetical protein